MKYVRAALAAVSIMASASPAFAQATRTWVSGVGDDVNPCSRTAPCKTFAGAISKTAAGGEINALDPGGYGSVTITKSMTIDGEGTMASILAVNTNGFVINGAGIVVNLRNLSINCADGTIGNGIRIINAAAVNIDNLTIANCAGSGTNGRGVVVETASNVRVTVQNSRIANMGNYGIHSNPSGGLVSLLVDRTTLGYGRGAGIQLRQNTNATVNDVTIAHYSGAALATELASVNAHVSNSIFTDNAVGIINGTSGAATTRISASVISGSTTAGLQIQSGQVISSGNNVIRGNAGNETPSSTETLR